MPLPDLYQKPPMRSIQRPMKRLIAPIVAVVACFCALCAYVLIEARRNTLERAAEVSTSLVNSMVADISRNIETVDLSLQGVVDNLKRPELVYMGPELRNLFLFDRSVTAHHLGKIVVLDDSGKVRLDSSRNIPLPLNRADRDYFRAHKSDPNLGMHISRPAWSRGDGYWFVALSRRLSNDDGSFAGIVVASLRLSYFEDLFKNIAIGPHSSVSLSRSDGILLTRWPFKEGFVGLDLGGAKIFKEFAASRAGRFEAISATDGQHRLFVYSQVGNLPLIVALGQSTSDIYEQWYEYAFGVILVLVVICMMTLLAAIYLAHELGRRRDAEEKLAVLAATDALTALANRRHFNDSLVREWQRAKRDKSPLSVLMIDADKFKTFNDTRGHQAGDNMLRILGIAIADSVERGGDVGARLGGDEFAILLPDTGVIGAERVAEKLRASFTELCHADGDDALGLSIGVACVIPSTGMRTAELIGLADLALYRAKDLGRNRTEVATPAIGETLAVPADGHKAA